ncbi:hypothetical protein H5410_040687 [Solanum commersonii]|uniref:CCHC-type domain-containing protein n=1 Tax=Solanum commersonii TaxID=4109 RepID=A0A9J5XQU8_SOLCO|nr:hypothetical protein H5410_040687 [Solanum commersonii]
MEIPECNGTHWKSKFIDGLPTLFAERVRKAIRAENHSINLMSTYGKLISACVQERLALCNEIKLNQQIKQHRLNERKQLGEFCEQFAFDIPKKKSKEKEYTPKNKKSSKNDYEKWKKKRIEKKLSRAEEGKGDSSKRKKKYRQNYNRSDTCHKCERFGQYAKDCRVKGKIKSLDIGDNIKDSLYKIMLNSDLEKSGSENSSDEGSSTTASSSGTSGIDINHPMYKEFINFMQSKKELDNNPTYSSIMIDDENIDVFDMNDKKEVILLLEENDLKWRNKPWQIMARTFYTKFWSKLLQKNSKGKIHGQEIIDLINVKISKYYDTATMEPQVIEDLSPFKKITRKLQMKKGLISKSKAIALYMEEVKKDLMRNLDIDIKDDISMATGSHTNEEDDTCVVGEGQDVDEEIDIEVILRNYQQQIEESSSTSTTGKGKEKA